MTSGRKSIDEVYQRDKFWNLMEMEGIVNKTKIHQWAKYSRCPEENGSSMPPL